MPFSEQQLISHFSGKQTEQLNYYKKSIERYNNYAWKTGELVHGISGSGWRTNSFPLVYKTKTMTYNMGDETSRVLMNLDPGEMYCFIHYNLLPLVVENYKNIQTGLEM